MTRHTVAAALLSVLGALPGTPLPAATTPWAQKLTQQALDSGFLTRLPPTVSTAFALPKAADGTDVRQLLTKDGHRIRTFNVSVASHSDLVVFNVDAQSGATVAYLLAPDGQLRKAVSYTAGGKAQPLAPADAKAGFSREARYWSARARKAPATAAAAPATPPAAPASSAAAATPPKQ
jgi:hypothetical protein